MNNFYDHTTYPSQGGAGSSAALRAELDLIEAGFDKLPTLTAHASEVVVVNAGATALETTPNLTVAQGGSGRATGTTAYALVATGTTATGAQQTLASAATTDILVGGGAAALPVWTTATGSGAPVRATSATLVAPALGTPASGTVTNLTGTASININGTVGATTPNTVAATTITASGVITTNTGAPGFSVSNQGTNAARSEYSNTGGTFYVGLDNAGGGLGGAYTANLWHSGPYSIVFGTGNVERMRLSSTGLAVTGAISATTDSTINGLNIGRGAGNVSTNTRVGLNALYSNTTGYNNTANGVSALYSNTTGYNNTASGLNALLSNSTGVNNTASGSQALYFNTTGVNNTASGFNALYSNTTGVNNTASGVQALLSNTTGSYNTASGFQALLSNTTGYNNTASGIQALYSNTTGYNNTASGFQALYYNTTGVNNTASGFQALYYNTTGYSNTASGFQALYSNTTGNNNTASGFNALYSNTTGSGNTAFAPLNSAGTYAPVFNPTTEDNRFCMGSTGVTNAYIQVAWTVVSDERDKADFASIPHGLDFVTKLNPISYRYKANRSDAEAHGPVRYGFKAQEVLALEGNSPVITDNEDLEKLRITSDSLIPVLVKAIQELKAEFDAYKLTHP